MFLAILTLLSALSISSVAAYFSILGLAAIFQATYWPVVGMGIILESGKIVAATWLHQNWKNARVSIFHKTYLSIAVIVLMLITSMGIFGFLSKGHLDQAAPSAGINIQIEAVETQIQSDTDQLKRYQDELSQLDRQIDSFLTNNKTEKSDTVRQRQKKERDQISAGIKKLNIDTADLNKKKFDLKQQLTESDVKLGPIKYIAELIFADPASSMDSAVRIVILMIVFAFDPVAILLVIGAAISFNDWQAKRIERKEKTITASIKIPEPRTEIIQEQSERGRIILEKKEKNNIPESHVETIREQDQMIFEKLVELIKSNEADITDLKAKLALKSNAEAPIIPDPTPNTTPIKTIQPNELIDLSVIVSYHTDIDTLYINKGTVTTSYTEQQPDGLLFKKDQKTLEPINVTVPFYFKTWNDKVGELIVKASKFLNVDPRIVSEAMAKVKLNEEEPRLKIIDRVKHYQEHNVRPS
jgi:hypothetical protein